MALEKNGSFTLNIDDEKIDMVIQLSASNFSYAVKRSELIEFRLEQDIFNVFTKCYITLKDTGNNFSLNMKANGDCWSYVCINQDSTGSLFEDVFILNYAPIITYSPEATTVKLEFESFKSLVLYNRLIFSNYDKASEDVIDIIKHLLSKASNPSLKLKSFESENIADLDSLIKAPTDNIDKVSSGAKMQYIADRNSVIKTHIDYLLNIANSKQNGFYFLFFNPFENKYEFINTKAKYIEEVNTLYAIIIGSSEANSRGGLTARNVKTYLRNDPLFSSWNNIPNTLLKLEEHYKNSQIVDFELKNNNFKIQSIKKTDINDLFLNGNKNESEIILPNSKESSTFKYGYRMSEYWNYQENLRDIFLKYEEIDITVPGVLSRLPGNYLNVSFKMRNSDKRLNGKWFIKTISHIFSNSTYDQHLVCCRTENDIMDKLEERDV